MCFQPIKFKLTYEEEEGDRVGLLGTSWEPGMVHRWFQNYGRHQCWGIRSKTEGEALVYLGTVHQSFQA